MILGVNIDHVRVVRGQQRRGKYIHHSVKYHNREDRNLCRM